MSKIKDKVLALQERAQELAGEPNRHSDATRILFRIPEAVEAVIVRYQDSYRAKHGRKISKATAIAIMLHLSIAEMEKLIDAMAVTETK